MTPYPAHPAEPPRKGDYYREREQIRRENHVYITCFQEYLERAGLSERIRLKHIENATFFLNEYLLGKYDLAMQDGPDQLEDFFEFFIRKCLWSTPLAIKDFCASIKKFYKCMLESGYLLESEYRNLCSTIKEQKQDWMDTCAMYNKGSDVFLGEPDDGSTPFASPSPLGCKPHGIHKPHLMR